MSLKWHNAPWTNASTSARVAAATRDISLTDSSRPTTTRPTPRAAANSAPSALVMLIWVLPWMGRQGATRRTRSTTPRSCGKAGREGVWGGGDGGGGAGEWVGGVGGAGPRTRGASTSWWWGAPPPTHLHDESVHTSRARTMPAPHAVDSHTATSASRSCWWGAPPPPPTHLHDDSVHASQGHLAHSLLHCARQGNRQQQGEPRCTHFTATIRRRKQKAASQRANNPGHGQPAREADSMTCLGVAPHQSTAR